MPNVRFTVEAHATGAAAEEISNHLEVFAHLDLEDLTQLTEVGSLFIESISFENLDY